MRILSAFVLFILATAVAGSEYERQRNGNTNQVAVQVQKAQAAGSAVINGASIPKPADAPAIAPNPSAHSPSAQCRYGWSVTGAGVGFGAGISASEWDEICGLWMAAQQTTGDARQEAANAAFCLTMKKAKVQSRTCADWDNGQNLMMAKHVEMNTNDATIIFTGASDR